MYRHMCSLVIGRQNEFAFAVSVDLDGPGSRTDCAVLREPSVGLVDLEAV